MSKHRKDTHKKNKKANLFSILTALIFKALFFCSFFAVKNKSAADSSDSHRAV